ncbi:translocation/assembly module TamB domain-containing protein [uncultured Paraglaciecola sp.]|uniref:autotransporter assembly complex protein TamB n=1 Tax=uncultured Paraglaciecola sp. TaxID=1765024 RepID=UPI0030DB5D0D|tara:strand:+ start:93328 stop:97209 length:3882 start_codon:yes stop_codon:yes gene_type:complete
MTLGTDEQPAVKKHNIPSSLIRTLTRGLVKLAIVCIIVSSLLIGFLMTPWGTKAAIDTANNVVAELTIDYSSGGIGSELKLSSVKWKQAASQVEIENLQLSIQLSCVWRLALCIDSVSSDKMDVQIQAAESSPDAESTAAAFTLPFPVSADSIELNKFSLKVQGSADISWQKLTGKLDFYRRLRIDMMQLDGFSLVTYALDAPPVTTQTKPFDWTAWQYQAITPLPFVLPIHFDILAFRMTNASVKLAGQENFTVKKASLKAKGSSKKIQLYELLIQHEQGQLLAKGHVQLDGNFEHVLSVDANAELVELNPLTLALRSSGNINGLTTQIELIESTQSAKAPKDNSQNAPLKLEMDFTAQPSKANLPVKLRLNWKHLVWPITAVPQFKSAAGVMDVKGDLNALKLDLVTSLSGQNIPDTKIKFNGIAASTLGDKRFEINELLLETLGGQILSQGNLSFSDYIKWQGHSNISHIDPSVFWPELVADINGELSTQASNNQGIWKAKLNKFDIQGQWQGYPLTMSGNVDFHENDGLQLSALSLKNADNTLLLDGKVSKQQAVDIQFSLDAAELANSIPQLSGSLNLSGNLSGDIAQPEVSYELSGSQLLFSEVLVEQAEGKGTIKWNQQKPVDLKLDLRGIQGINNQIDSAQFVLNGDASHHQLDLTTSGQSSVNLSIQGQLNQSSWEGNWLTGDIESSYANLTLPKPFKMAADWSNQQYFIAPHCWVHTNNELCIKLAQFKENILSWDVSLKEFDVLSVVRRLMPEIPQIQTKSRLNLEMSGDWDIESLPNVTLSASLSSGEWLFGEQNNLSLTLDETLVKAQINQKNILANINLSGSKLGALSVSLEGKSGVYAEPLTRPIQGELLIERFDLAAFKALVPQLDVLQGEINGQAKIDGTLGSPLLTGELSLANGALKDESLPVALSAIEQSIKLRGQSADFAGTYKLGKGLGKMDGDITWTPSLKGNLNISGEELEFDYQSMIKARVSPAISLMFEPNNLEIKGEVTIPYARVKVRDLPKDTISPSKDVILVEKQAELNASQQRLALNVLLKVDPQNTNNVKLDAFGLTTDLRGELRLQNNKTDIFGSGEVQLVNGRYRAYGQNLVIREGDILFTSSLDRPFLNIEAVRDPDLTSDSVIAGLRVEGVAQNPSISVFSEPVMEQQQILSYMLTGRGMGESSGDSQDTILANALLSLGLGQSENLISKVGNKLGFEDVILDTSGQGEATQLSLTGTIAPGVQLRYGVGVFDSISEVAIRYELIPQLYIEAVSGVSNAIDIYYQFSIEGSQNKQVKDD